MFVCPHSGYRFYSIIVARFGIESMHEIRDSENNHRDYGIARDKVRDIWDFPCSKLGIRDFKAKGGRRSGLKVCTICRIPKKNIRITGLREIRFGIRDFKAKQGRDSGLKVCTGCGIPKITLEITGLRENLSRDDTGIDNPY